jgi:hypothetical protein
MKQPFIRCFILALALISFGCGSFPNIVLDRDADLSSIRTIGIFLFPSDKSASDKQLFNIFRMKLTSLGYTVLPVSPVWTIRSADTAHFTTHQEIAKSVFAAGAGRPDAVIILRPEWDIVLRTAPTKRDGEFIVILEKLVLESTMFTSASGVPLISRKITRLEDLYSDKDNLATLSSSNIMIQKTADDVLKGFPVSPSIDTTAAAHRIPVIFYVDSAYVDYYGASWDLRLQKRMLFVNDVFRRQFNTEFEILDFRAWRPSNDTSVELSMNDLIGRTKNVRKMLVAGMMVNDKLIHRWREWSEAGLAEIHGQRFIACNLTYLPGMEEWNAVTESAVMIHELGHVFGACHIRDVSSAMYPSTNIISNEFDSLNSAVIVRNIAAFGTKDRVTKILEELSQWQSAYMNGSSKKIMYLPHIYGLLETLKNIDNPPGMIDSLRIEDLSVPAADSAFRFALIGFHMMIKDRWEDAEVFFLKAIKERPKFSEPYRFLAVVYSKMGKDLASEDYREQGIELLRDETDY